MTALVTGIIVASIQVRVCSRSMRRRRFGFRLARFADVSCCLANPPQIGVFMVIRNRFRKIYNPRSYLVEPK